MSGPSCVIEDITEPEPAITESDPPANGSSTSAGAAVAGESGAAAAGGAAASAAASAGPSDTALPMQPPEDCEAITPDRGVLKRTLVPGTGEKPCLHARCLVHYVGYLAATGEAFMDTRADTDSREPAVLVAGRDSSSRDVGLQLAVAAMAKGERAAVYVTDPEYGYGKQGSFSFPSVPPSSALVFDVTLVEWEPPEERADRRGMLFEERLEAAERRRLEGNALFAEGKLVEALGKYALALSYTDEDFLLQLEGPHLDRAEAVMVPVQLNMAAAQLKMGDFHTAVHNCSQVLARDRDNAKALFRRGRARAALGQTEEAVADLEAASKLAPQDKVVLRELHAMRQQLKTEHAASAKLFKGAFGAAPAPKPGGGGSSGVLRSGDGGGAGAGAAAVQAAWSQGGAVAWLLGGLWAALAWLLGTSRRALGGASGRRGAS